MHVHPDIAALQSDPALQRRTLARMEAAKDVWLTVDEVHEVASGLKTYANGGELADIPGLCAVLTDHARATDFVNRYAEAFAEALRREPLGEVPMQHRSSAGYARIQLMRSGGAVLSLCVYEPVADHHVPQSASFVDCASEEILIAGAATGYLQCLQDSEDGKAAAISRKHRWNAGDCISRRAERESRQFVTVDQSLLILQLTRTPAKPNPSREYRLSDGALVRQSSGDKRASEQLMALAVLGALGGTGAIDQMAKFACDIDRDPDARWEAVRQVLAMDGVRGMVLLGRLVSKKHDPLAVPAASLRDQVLASQPAFRQLVTEAQ